MTLVTNTMFILSMINEHLMTEMCAFHDKWTFDA